MIQFLLLFFIFYKKTKIAPLSNLVLQETAKSRIWNTNYARVQDECIGNVGKTDELPLTSLFFSKEENNNSNISNSTNSVFKLSDNFRKYMNIKEIPNVEDAVGLPPT